MCHYENLTNAEDDLFCFLSLLFSKCACVNAYVDFKKKTNFGSQDLDLLLFVCLFCFVLFCFVCLFSFVKGKNEIKRVTNQLASSQLQIETCHPQAFS